MGFIEVKDLKVHYPIRSGFFNRITDYVYAVDGVNLHFEEGKTYGLVGESGSGKSTIGKTIIGLERTTSGEIIYEGQNVTNKSRRKKGNFNRDVQMIFQDSLSSFNPKKRILDIIAEPIRNFDRLSPDEEKKRVLRLLDTIGLTEEALVKYPHEFSGGQRQRIGVARALASNPRLIIADEPVSALDLSVQAQVLNYMKRIQDEYKLSYLFISHDLGVVQHMCDELYIMYRGRFVETGSKEDIYNHPQHIYTKRLLSAIPSIDPINRAQNKAHRLAAEQEYLEKQSIFYDENGRVFDLKRFTDTHQVALPETKGGI
ncbi:MULTISPECIES: ATP-binding cassette domain-containing protein [unclassified Streptococcus]|uniref:ATP-binding cassette domain-containing protein n=1 Tax=unclassified Streptococcus TaxID=2608887 RepID=UPI0010726A72|nr:MULTISPECIES: ATP-binding cassette domain-containing protein [unclassified Streptococcus]MBF0787723.1 ABC transporter ATP-binding protein [Streptococcus sp. 19428wC2_LYSM12]MCQ9211206.1 ATP-binding cassette domain-containing protein [Streptococcus sp. B01]MCQ9214481.1 ATP-binding cassette domain-containing protein [Streptococcus sp. O1]TFV05332.1 ABC transporter ATP-binding protein [Streptococcus sp. LYSM12]